jgi:hypothetical protein
MLESARVVASGIDQVMLAFAARRDGLQAFSYDALTPVET